jgi:hypothetical protein
MLTNIEFNLETDNELLNELWKHSIKSIPISGLIDDFLEILIYGKHFFEIIYSENEGNFYISNIVGFKENSLRFDLDEKGKVKNLYYGEYTLQYPKFILELWNDVNNNHTGNPLITKDCVGLVLEIRKLHELELTYIDRHLMPLLVGKTSMNKKSLLNALKNIKSGLTNIVINENENIESIEASSNTLNFEELIRTKDLAISNSLNLGDILVGSDNKTGSYSSGALQYSLFIKTINGLIKDFKYFLEEIVKRLIYTNINTNTNAVNFSIVAEKYHDELGLNPESVFDEE